MAKIIKDGGIVDDIWTLLDSDSEPVFDPQSEHPSILPLSLWLQQPRQLRASDRCPGLWIEAEQDLAAISADIGRVPVIAIRFSSFADGTAFSTGATLREVLGFEGELRAFGGLIADQVPLLRRCGFNVFALAEDKDLELALQLLINSQLSYQGSIYSPRTPFKFRYLNGDKQHA